MSNYPKELRYSKEHEWARLEGKTITLGITDYAAEQLGDVVHVELPEIDAEFEIGAALGSVESVKSVSDVFLPVSGKVLEINETLLDNPALLNEDPYGEGWIVKIELTNPGEIDQLLSSDAYAAFLSEEA